MDQHEHQEPEQDAETEPSDADEPEAPDEPASEPNEAAAPRTPADVVRAAREAQQAWAERPVADRLDALAELRGRLLARAPEIAEQIVAETHKPHPEAVLVEAVGMADMVEYWLDSLEELLAGQSVLLSALAYPGKAGRVRRDPRGVVAVIAPWSYPLAIALRTIVPALLCGNAIVLKPSELTPGCGRLVASLFDGLLPEGVLTVLQGGPEVGAALVASDVDLVVFTGSVANGRAVARACAERFVPCSLDLGGKDAAIVLADCDVERTAAGLVWGAFHNTGQNCAAVQRIYVEKPVADKLVGAIVALVKKLRPGHDLGEVVTREQRQRLRRQVSEAVEAGADVLCGGIPDDDAQSPAPTVLRVERDDLAIVREPSFGPVLPIRVVADVDEAVRLANESRFALTTSVWTKRLARAHALVRRLRASIVTINNHACTSGLAEAPWTGVGDSGGGVTGGPHALALLTRPRFVLEDRGSRARDLWWFPYSPTLRALALAIAAGRGGASLVIRLLGVLRALPLLVKRILGDR